MVIKLRIVCYNIAEGNRYNVPANSNLPALAEQIRGKSPDIVLLNEARIDNGWPFGSGVNQFKMLSNLTGLAYYARAEMLPWKSEVSP
jgi:endonuclease/exonuclease/phosphatase family metal-dependent hydrolase